MRSINGVKRLFNGVIMIKITHQDSFTVIKQENFTTLKKDK